MWCVTRGDRGTIVDRSIDEEHTATKNILNVFFLLLLVLSRDSIPNGKYMTISKS